MLDQVGEKALCEIMRIFHGVPAAAHETIKRRPIGLAKLRERSLRNIRFGPAFPSRDNHASARPRKEVASALPVSAGSSRQSIVSKPQKTSKPAKKVTIPCSARSGVRLYKGKRIIMRNH